MGMRMSEEMERGEGPQAVHAGETEAERLRRELEGEQQRLLRLRADFENVRRRQAREQEKASREGRRGALLPLLPVLDMLERALDAGSSDPEFYKGVAATRELFLTALREAGAEPIDSLGRPFDPEVHEAMATMRSDSVLPGTVVREMRRGWRLGDELLRPTQVVVAVAAREAGEPWQ